MKRRGTMGLALLTAVAGFIAARFMAPQRATASRAGAQAPLMVGFQFVPAQRQGQQDLLIRAWDDGDFEYIPVSREGRDDDPVRWLWTEANWRLISYYPPRP